MAGAGPHDRTSRTHRPDPPGRRDAVPCPGRRALVLGAVAGLLSGSAAWAADRPEPFLSLRHASTGETLSSRFERRGRLDRAQARRLEWFMRDWREGRSMPVDPMLLRFLACIRHFAVREGHDGEIVLHSGFRTKSTNDMLRRAGLGAARNSLHLVAKAADISLAGIRPSIVAAAARRAGLGGVGRYRGFVHVDTGRPRHWTG